MKEIKRRDKNKSKGGRFEEKKTQENEKRIWRKRQERGIACWIKRGN